MKLKDALGSEGNKKKKIIDQTLEDGQHESLYEYFLEGAGWYAPTLIKE